VALNRPPVEERLWETLVIPLRVVEKVPPAPSVGEPGRDGFDPVNEELSLCVATARLMAERILILGDLGDISLSEGGASSSSSEGSESLLVKAKYELAMESLRMVLGLEDNSVEGGRLMDRLPLLPPPVVRALDDGGFAGGGT
jgi:hypothetical protein